MQQDANFNVTALVDGSGSVVERYVYDAFGARTAYDASYNVRSGGSSYGFQHGFQGMWFDEVAGLNSQRFRWYSSTLGRWVSVDPIRLAGGTNNLYEYVQNSPPENRDPAGLMDDHEPPTKRQPQPTKVPPQIPLIPVDPPEHPFIPPARIFPDLAPPPHRLQTLHSTFPTHHNGMAIHGTFTYELRADGTHVGPPTITYTSDFTGQPVNVPNNIPDGKIPPALLAELNRFNPPRVNMPNFWWEAWLLEATNRIIDTYPDMRHRIQPAVRR